MTTYQNPTNKPIYPSDAHYETEEALWLAGPLDLAMMPPLPGDGELEDLDWNCDTAFQEMAWVSCATLGEPDTTTEWRSFAKWAVDCAQRAEPPIRGWSVEGFVVPIYPGHFVYRGQIYVAPALFFPWNPAHVIVFEDTVVHVFLDRKWHGGARKVTAISATAAEEWRVPVGQRLTRSTHRPLFPTGQRYRGEACAGRAA